MKLTNTSQIGAGHKYMRTMFTMLLIIMLPQVMVCKTLSCDFSQPISSLTPFSKEWMGYGKI